MAKKNSKKSAPTQTRAQRQAATASSARAKSARPVPAEATPPGLRTFVDVSVVRVQGYLARTGDLRGFRGASRLVSSATSHEHWEQRLPPNTKINPEAGDIDGVLSIEVTADPDETDTCTTQLAIELVSELRALLPAAYLTAVRGDGTDYVHAYQQMKTRRSTGDLLRDSPPPANEVVLAKPCDRCLAWPATDRIATHSDNATVDADKQGCVDCLQRYRDGTKGHDADWRPIAETRLLSALRPRQPERIRGFADDYGMLATGDHLALIYADGNRVGDFIDTAARLPAGGIDTSRLAPMIQNATVEALAEAIATISSPLPESVPVLPHILGGDDVILTVRAEHAWAITLTLLDRFAQLMAAQTRGLGRSPQLPALSMSAGLVFFHRKNPFVDVVDAARRELDHAKEGVRGQIGSVAHLDIPSDGDRHPEYRPVWILTDLLDRRARLSEVATLPSAHRSTLLTLLRNGRDEEARRRIQRQDSRTLTDLEAAGLTIRDQLDLARWWPTK